MGFGKGFLFGGMAGIGILSGIAILADKLEERKNRKELEAGIEDPIRDRRNYLKRLKKYGYSTCPLFVMAAKSMSEANDILIKTYRMRAFLIGETLENEQGLFFCTNELPEGCKLFTFALKNAKNEDIFDLKIPSAVANYYYFETDYVNHIKETKKMEDFFENQKCEFEKDTRMPEYFKSYIHLHNSYIWSTAPYIPPKEKISKILYEKAFPYFNKETGIFDEELFFAEHPDAKVDKEKKEWKKFDEI